MLKWVGGIVSSIIAGLIVWWVISQFGVNVPVKPELPKSFLEKVSGSYKLESWEKASEPIELGVSVKDGTLRIDGNGEANWDLGYLGFRKTSSDSCWDNTNSDQMWWSG